MLIHRKNSCCGSKNTNSNSSSGGSGGGGGGGGDWDVSFNYYFLKKPWSPGYVTGSSFNPPYNWVYGTFDASSGFYDAADQRLELNWILPPRVSAGFNFSVPPRQLNDNTINLEPGTYSNVGILDICYNYLPYHETLKIDYRTRTPPSITWGNWTTLSTSHLALSGNPKPNLYPQTRGAYFVAGVGTITGIYGNNSGSPPVPQYVYQNTNFFPLGNDQYQFRIYLTNSSQEVLDSPDYFGTIDPSWNYLYMPDTSDNFLSFGQFGPATPPLFIAISSTNYRLLNINGANNNDGTNNIDTVNPVADASLNTLFTQLSAYGLFVNFGFDLSGQLHSSSKQVFVPPVTTITSRSYVSNNLQQNSWAQNQLIGNYTITPAGDNFSSTGNDIIFPGFEYSVSEYFMRLSSDFSYNVYTTQYPTPTPYPSVIVSQPPRNTVSTDYINMLSQGTQNLTYSIPSDLQNVSGDAYILATAYPPTPYTPSPQSVYFLSSTSEYKLDKPSLQYSLINKRRVVESTDLGTDLSGQDLCRFSLSTNSSVPQTITSQYTVGFVGNDSSQSISNQYFELGVSESIDATKLPGQTTTEAYRLRGWYLGVDLSNIKVLGINLTNYPDISNNTPPYTDWTIDLKQEFSGNETDKDLELCSLTIGAAPTQSVTLTNYTKTDPLPVLTTDFFGLGRPQNNVVASFTVTGLLSNLYTTWRPGNTIMTGELLYASSNSGASGNQFDNYTEGWPNTNPPTVNLSEILEITKSDIQASAYNYSRDRNFTPQFYITGSHKNNVTLTPVNISVNNLDISFNGKPLWWDYTWVNTSSNPPGTWTSGSGNISFSSEFMNVGAGLYPTVNGGGTTDPFVVYSHQNAITSNMMMWANGAFRAGQGGGQTTDNPFIDYTQYYEDPNTPVNQENYLTYTTSGFTIGTISYTQSSVNIYYDGTSSQPTWQTTTNAKTMVIRTDNPIDTALGGTNNVKILIKDGSSTLVLGTDYFLQVLEEYTGSGSAPYPLISGGNAYFTGWRDVQKSNQFAGAPAAKTGNGAPAFMNGTNYLTDYFVETINQNTGGNTVRHYFRINLPYNSTKKITSIQISFG